MSKVLKFLMGLLGLWLIITISVFNTGPALWIAFGTAIAITLFAVTDFAVDVYRRDAIASGASALIALGAGFLIIATLIFEGAAVQWLVGIFGGAIGLIALAPLCVAHLRRRREVAVPAQRAETPTRQVG